MWYYLRNPARNLRACLVATSLLVSGTGAATAQDVTPSHVYQVTDDILNELDQLHFSNFSTANYDKVQRKENKRLPRHVLQAGIVNLRKFQTLRYINGLETSSITQLPVREIQPSEVHEIAKQLKENVLALHDVYKIAKPATPVRLKEDKTPTDVYLNMLRISASLDALGLPATVPNDVFVVANQITQDLDMLIASITTDKPRIRVTPSWNKRPKDAYEQGYALFKDLEKLSQKQGWVIPGGVIIPIHHEGDITPSQVIEVMNSLLADISSFKALRKVPTPTPDGEAAAGKTPSHVYDRVSLARKQVAWLIENGE